MWNLSRKPKHTNQRNTGTTWSTQLVPTKPWQVVGTDLFTWNLLDYYSKFPIIEKIHNGQSTGQTVVRLTKCVMSEQGVPEVIISDNGPQYDCQSYKQFSKEWASNIQSPAQDTNSPTGFFEWQVQTVKKHFRQGCEIWRGPSHVNALS